MLSLTDWDDKRSKSVASDYSSVVHDVLRSDLDKLFVHTGADWRKCAARLGGVSAVQDAGTCEELWHSAWPAVMKLIHWGFS